MNIFEYNGGVCVAMMGKKCVAIASDLRLGQGGVMISNNFSKIVPVTEKLYMGLSGLATDITMLSKLIRYKTNMYKLREERVIEPKTLSNLLSTTLYQKRFASYFVMPIIAGIDSITGEPFICGLDNIGCIDTSKDFVVSGTASEQLYGICECLWTPDLEPDDLFETISQALLNAQDRDALSGMGAVVYVISQDKVTKSYLKGRQD
ncbi:hypothetical protein T552_00613 [Pneumocystis carinii B80]|uniref:Proteasome subunit beta n=1 Tax=Pneumocystis carinii (strain B80) TaxID=1408658 RepID=A0A0W4ZP25_PNEC8|nr:hypothetical protein T552_00613 [Pneumocystis carinii B80]KTW30135.1 hypothetical protein T552_00613 [Pneumocystis carinii B80]